MPADAPPDDAREPASEPDFEAVQAALREIDSMRWFLDEHARRIRRDESARILSAIGGLANMIALQGAARENDAARRFAQLASALEERFLDMSWYLRGRGVDAPICELIDREARRLGRVAAGELFDLDPLELPAPPHAAPNAPIPVATVTEAPAAVVAAETPEPTSAILAETPREATAVAAVPAPSPEREPEPVLAAVVIERRAPPLRPGALAWIDELSFDEKLRLFA